MSGGLIILSCAGFVIGTIIAFIICVNIDNDSYI